MALLQKRPATEDILCILTTLYWPCALVRSVRLLQFRFKYLTMGPHHHHVHKINDMHVYIYIRSDRHVNNWFIFFTMESHHHLMHKSSSTPPLTLSVNFSSASAAWETPFCAHATAARSRGKIASSLHRRCRSVGLQKVLCITAYYGVASVSRIDKIIGLFCKRAL